MGHNENGAKRKIHSTKCPGLNKTKQNKTKQNKKLDRYYTSIPENCRKKEANSPIGGEDRK